MICTYWIIKNCFYIYVCFLSNDLIKKILTYLIHIHFLSTVSPPVSSFITAVASPDFHVCVGESEHELQLNGHLGCVSLKETACLPPISEMICSDPLSLPSNKQKRKHIIMRPSEDENYDLNVLSVTRSLPNLFFTVRHQKRVHYSKDTVNTPETPSSFMTAVITESDDDQEWPEDHSGLINEPDYECGMNIRKRRLPCLDSNVRHPNTRQRNAYRIKWECRDNWTSRGALDSI